MTVGPASADVPSPMGMAMGFEFNQKLDAEKAKAHYGTDKFIVRCYDGFDNQWCDCTGALPWDEAWKELMRLTKGGTANTKFADIDYYSVFPSDTTMLYSGGFGET